MKPLTRREDQIARMVAYGRSNKDIARELEISIETVQTHIANAVKKLTNGDGKKMKPKIRLVRYVLLEQGPAT